MKKVTLFVAVFFLSLTPFRRPPDIRRKKARRFSIKTVY